MPAAVQSFTLIRNRAVKGKTAIARAKTEFEDLTVDTWHGEDRERRFLVVSSQFLVNGNGASR